MTQRDSIYSQIMPLDINGPKTPNEPEKRAMWKIGILRFQSVINKPVVSKGRPQTTMVVTTQVRCANDESSKHFPKTIHSTKTQPVFINDNNQDTKNNRLTSYQDTFNVTYRSFDAHFQKHTAIVHSYEDKSWEISQRIYKRKLEQTKIRHKELNPVPSLIDEYAIEAIHDDRNKERRLNNLPAGHPIKRHQIPPERKLTVADRPRVFFWG